MKTPAPWEAAIQAHHEVLAFLHGPMAPLYLESWEERRFQRYGLEHSQPSNVAGTYLLPDVYQADPIYISPDMLQVVYSAMEGFDSTEDMDEDDFFIENGFAYLPEPFYSIDSTGHKLGWRAISWNLATMITVTPEKFREFQAQGAKYVGEDDNWIALKTDEDVLRENGIDPDEDMAPQKIARITLWSNTLDPNDDYPSPPDEVFRMLNTYWLISHMTAIPVAVIPDIRQVREEGDPQARWLTFLRVLNRVMAEKIISKERHQAPRVYRREAQRRNWPVKDVVVVELRRRSQGSTEAPTGKREYSHQWIVEGFWRNQWYPSLGKHRQKYIASYVKGPKDKPLITKGRVWNLDR